MKFDGVTDFSTKDPDLLRRELQDLNRLLKVALRDLERAARPGPRLVASDTAADFAELVIVDSTTGDVQVELPRVTTGDEGREVRIGRKSASNAVTVVAAGTATVNGASSVSLTAAIGLRIFTVAGGHWYGHHV
jgi:hypothetical protein